MSDILTEAMKIIGITRVVAKPLAKQVSTILGASFSDEEMWFAPNGDVIGLYTPEEGLAALRRVVRVIERERES